MYLIKSIEELRQLPAEIRAKRRGFITNFFLDPVKHGVWIAKGDCLAEYLGNTLFIIKSSPTFWNVFYCSTTLDEFSNDLSAFITSHSSIIMMFDIVGRDVQCLPLVELFSNKGFKEATSLVRMTRMTEPLDYRADSTVRKASIDDITLVSKYLHSFFDEKTEQIPYDEELYGYAQQEHIIVCEEHGQILGFLIYELNASTIYLRYWFTHPDYRNRKVGSRLLRCFFEEGKNTKRQLFWVIRTNDNAIKRYKHYGFSEDNMFDFVMRYN